MTVTEDKELILQKTKTKTKSKNLAVIMRKAGIRCVSGEGGLVMREIWQKSGDI